MTTDKISYRKEVEVPLFYRNQKIHHAFRIDFLIEDEVILELKSMESFLPVHKAQLLTYLKLANKSIGLLINFNVSLLKNGIRRCILTNAGQQRKILINAELEKRRRDTENEDTQIALL